MCASEINLFKIHLTDTTLIIFVKLENCNY